MYDCHKCGRTVTAEDKLTFHGFDYFYCPNCQTPEQVYQKAKNSGHFKEIFEQEKQRLKEQRRIKKEQRLLEITSRPKRIFKQKKQKYIPEYTIVSKRFKSVELVKEFKESSKCFFCSENDPNKLTFHHRHKHEKLFNIGRKISIAPYAIYKEIKKCEVLCYSCHGYVHTGKLVIPGTRAEDLINIYGTTCEPEKVNYKYNPLIDDLKQFAEPYGQFIRLLLPTIRA